MLSGPITEAAICVLRVTADGDFQILEVLLAPATVVSVVGQDIVCTEEDGIYGAISANPLTRVSPTCGDEPYATAASGVVSSAVTTLVIFLDH
jgi:hypothetical protein